MDNGCCNQEESNCDGRLREVAWITTRSAQSMLSDPGTLEQVNHANEPVVVTEEPYSVPEEAVEH